MLANRDLLKGAAAVERVQLLVCVVHLLHRLRKRAHLPPCPCVRMYARRSIYV